MAGVDFKSSPRLEVIWDNISDGEGYRSACPPNMCLVTNLYIDPTTGKLVVEYDDNPV